MRIRMLAMMVGCASVLGAVPRLGAEQSGPTAPAGAEQAVTNLTFTYQGQLKQNNSPINGNADFRFTIFDDAGGPFGTTNVTLQVSNGIFTAVITSPGRIWDGQARMLEIAVRFPAGSGSFTTLAPRQPIRAVPYAMGLVPNAIINGDGGIGGGDPTLAIDTTNDGISIQALASQGTAIIAHSALNNGVNAESNDANGVVGTSHSPSWAGVRGVNVSQGYGVVGESSGNGVAIFGNGQNGALAGKFVNGDVDLLSSNLHVDTGNVGLDDGDLGLLNGDIGVAQGKASFGFTTRQMIDLWSTVYGIGVQSFTLYNRADLGAGFAWYQGGQHSDVAGDAGPGGTRLMYLDANGRVMARNGLWAQGLANNPTPLAVTGLIDADVEFRVSNVGEVFADGTFHPGGADFAELLPATDGLEPGDALIIGRDGKLTKSDETYQTSVVGVYSTQPGVLGGANDVSTEGKVPLAVVGVVPVKVTDENGAITPGDLLTTSSIPGHAMKASPELTASGRTSYPSGSIIGKALSGFEQGEGTVDVLLIAK